MLCHAEVRLCSQQYKRVGNKTIITFDNVSFGYDSDALTETGVLKNINLEIEKGQFIAVLGYNGSGKSTLAKHMNAINVPVNGDVTVEGINTKDDDRLLDIRQCIGMVFQNPDNQIVATIVEEDVAFALENLGVPSDEIRSRVDEALEIVGMSEHRTDAPYHLSGGQKQRVAIAGIIAMRPECIVLDEPTAMLDPQGRTAIIETVKRLNSEYGITIVLITHYMEEAAQADRIIILNDGKIAVDGTPKQVFSDVEKVRLFGLDVPQTTELCYILKQNGADISTDNLSIDECVDAVAKLLGGAV